MGNKQSLDMKQGENDSRLNGNPNSYFYRFKVINVKKRDLKFVCFACTETHKQITTHINPVKNVTGIFFCLCDGSLVENETKSDGYPIIFLANVIEMP